MLIAHGVGAFVAQKYLESYAASGLVLVAPFPPSPSSVLPRLSKASLLPGEPRANTDPVDWAALVAGEPDPSDLLRDAALAEQALHLEPVGHILPVLVVSTACDPVISHRDVSAMRAFHDLDGGGDDSVLRRGHGGHLTMADPDWEAAGGISDEIAAWISRRF